MREISEKALKAYLHTQIFKNDKIILKGIFMLPHNCLWKSAMLVSTRLPCL